jgi:lantibiotic biosynthesis protein
MSTPQTLCSSADWQQSLARGAPGIALLHIERARAGLASWEPVHRLAIAMTHQPVQANPTIASLFYGAPAVAYALHTAGQPAYRSALRTLDRSITTIIGQRLAAAHRRIDDSRIAQAGEYDLISGLTGLGAYLLHRDQDHNTLRDILTYLVRLTQPIRHHGETLPGWWATASPDRRRSPRWQGGHAGLGMAHGISGPLALLSTAMRRGISVSGHSHAIHTICTWLNQWRHGDHQQAWWPQVIDRAELRATVVSHPGPHRPSWCYGTPAIARAQQLAAIAVNDRAGVRLAEQVLLGCLTDRRQITQLTDTGLCHGWAGPTHIARCAAADTDATQMAAVATALIERARQHIHDAPTDEGLLNGATGTTLVATVDRPAPSRWDTFLLIT